ncbi:MAG: helix-turn-helix domain-containing protein [Planctomycetota bacterium]|nr:MAG: helix-turn-helix domain-containing protein [Planctomycetota bacterium]
MTVNQLEGIRYRPVGAQRLIVAPGCTKENYLFPHFSLCYMVRGSADYKFDDSMVTAHRGEIAFLPPDALRTSANNYREPCEVISVDFDVPDKGEARRLVDYYYERAARSDGNRGRKRMGMVLITGYRDEVARFFIQIQHELASGKPDSLAMASSLLAQLVIVIGRAAAEEKAASHDEPSGPSVAETWRAQEVWMTAVSYMADHLDKQVTVRTLAQQVRLSNQRFANLFKMYCNVSPMQYFTKMRLDSARELLLTSPASVKEITAMVGFSDPLYFSRAFRKHTGISPRAYRKGERARLQESRTD